MLILFPIYEKRAKLVYHGQNVVAENRTHYDKSPGTNPTVKYDRLFYVVYNAL